MVDHPRETTGVEAVLGGWFHGYGDTVNKAVATITGDYTMGSTARAPDVGAISRFGMYALTEIGNRFVFGAFPARRDLPNRFHRWCRHGCSLGQENGHRFVKQAGYSKPGIGRNQLFAIDLPSSQHDKPCRAGALAC